MHFWKKEISTGGVWLSLQKKEDNNYSTEYLTSNIFIDLILEL